MFSKSELLLVIRDHCAWVLGTLRTNCFACTACDGNTPMKLFLRLQKLPSKGIDPCFPSRFDVLILRTHPHCDIRDPRVRDVGGGQARGHARTHEVGTRRCAVLIVPRLGVRSIPSSTRRHGYFRARSNSCTSESYYMSPCKYTEIEQHRAKRTTRHRGGSLPQQLMPTARPQ